jgi:predicted outer membrane repeat protein
VTLSTNAAVGGGGIYQYVTGAVILSSTTLRGNTASKGAGIYSAGATSLADTTLSGNPASSDGGGIYNSAGTSLTNVTLSGNSARSSGGGIYDVGAALLRNVTLSGNSAATGSGIFTYDQGPGSYVTLTNTILAYSPTGGNCAGKVIQSAKYSISSDNFCALNGSGNLIRTDPLLTALGNYGGPTAVHMLKLGSQAIDVVVGTDAPPFDQRGLPRGQGLGHDAGSVERQPNDSSLAPRLSLPYLTR